MSDVRPSGRGWWMAYDMHINTSHGSIPSYRHLYLHKFLYPSIPLCNAPVPGTSQYIFLCTNRIIRCAYHIYVPHTHARKLLAPTTHHQQYVFVLSGIWVCAKKSFWETHCFSSKNRQLPSGMHFVVFASKLRLKTLAWPTHRAVYQQEYRRARPEKQILNELRVPVQAVRMAVYLSHSSSPGTKQAPS